MTSASCGALNFSWIESNRNVVFTEFIQRSGDSFHDVTLLSDDLQEFPANKMVLSACSTFFEQIFQTRRNESLVLFLASVKSKDLSNILEFVYKGTLNVPVDEVDQFISAGNLLKIKGIVSNEDSEAKGQRRKGRKRKMDGKNPFKEEKNNDNYKVQRESKKEIKEETEALVTPLEVTTNTETVKQHSNDDIPKGEETAIEEDPISIEGEKTAGEDDLIPNEDLTIPKPLDVVEEIKQNYSKGEIMKAYKRMMLIKGSMKDEGVKEVKDSKSPVRSGKMKACDGCEYITNHSSNFHRHKSTCSKQKQ